MQTTIRIMPTFVTGLICNVFIGLMAAFIPLVWLLGPYTSIKVISFLLLNIYLMFQELER